MKRIIGDKHACCNEGVSCDCTDRRSLHVVRQGDLDQVWL